MCRFGRNTRVQSLKAIFALDADQELSWQTMEIGRFAVAAITLR
jgi:hypothetical protein